MTLTAELIRRLAPKARDDYMTALVNGGATLEQYGFTTDLRLAALLATILHETGGLTIVRESGNYSAERLVQVWPNHFTARSAKAYAHQPEKIFNYVYGPSTQLGRDLGNTDPDDGWRFRGAGMIQTTGRYNFTKLGQAIGVDLASRPELIEDASISLKAACWEMSKFVQYCDMGERGWKAVCNGVNHGIAVSKLNPIGWADRMVWYQRCCDALETPFQISDDLLRVGDQGPLVKAIQERLAALNYPVGRADGIFGSRLRSAVLAFQAENHLTTDGQIGPETRAALNSEMAIAMPAGERATETASDLAKAGSNIVLDAQAIKKAAAALVVGGGTAGVTQQATAPSAPAFDPISATKDVVTEIGSWKAITTAIQDVVQYATSHTWIFLIVAGFAFWKWGSKIEWRRVLDHQLGLHLGR